MFSGTNLQTFQRDLMCSWFLRNVGKFPSDYTASYPITIVFKYVTHTTMRVNHFHKRTVKIRNQVMRMCTKVGTPDAAARQINAEIRSRLSDAGGAVPKYWDVFSVSAAFSKALTQPTGSKSGPRRRTSERQARRANYVHERRKRG
jgi:hypothetical protein